jgi:hypothetical protein
MERHFQARKSENCYQYQQNIQKENSNKKKHFFLQVHVESISKDLMNKKNSFCIEF